MHFTQTFDLHAYLDTLVSYAAALILGALIGAERQYRQRNAGLRTNALVALGAAAFVDLAQRLAGNAEAIRVIAYVVSGIGFLGAGVIMKEGMNVRGLNTAATLWCSAAVGAAAGTDMLAEAATLTVFVVAGNTLLRPVVNAINRIPLVGGVLEATYSVTVSTDPDRAPAVRDLLVDHLELMRYPVADTDLVERTAEHVDIVATLVSTAAIDADLDAIVAHLAAHHGIDHATWDVQTHD
ncbi:MULTISPECIES: MgtC/SapB family protein [Sphingomonas]|jgi:putative Mg2+ transporter-C (MgtC) family protein|uniref:MgtC/SapB family protein n=1 Tax=Sphingomonas TaxID=13687 RepID=UPI001AED8DA5|nr:MULTISPECIES: MgtC/SapB family protein [Sphingomonas]